MLKSFFYSLPVLKQCSSQNNIELDTSKKKTEENRLPKQLLYNNLKQNNYKVSRTQKKEEYEQFPDSSHSVA